MGYSLITVAYLVASVLFILSLSGLSKHETARRGNWFGIIGMLIGLIVTFGVSLYSHWHFQIFFLPPLAGCLISVLIGIFFGFYPDPLINTIEVSIKDLISIYNMNILNN